MQIARVDLSLAEASLKHATINALVGYLKAIEDRKNVNIDHFLRQNSETLDKRFVPWISPYEVGECRPSPSSGYWSEASLSVKYTMSVGGRSVDYACTVKLSGSVVSTSTEGVYYVVTARFYDENGLMTNPNLAFNPKPVKVEVSGDALKLYYFQRPSAIEVVGERALKVHLRP